MDSVYFRSQIFQKNMSCYLKFCKLGNLARHISGTVGKIENYIYYRKKYLTPQLCPNVFQRIFEALMCQSVPILTFSSFILRMCPNCALTGPQLCLNCAWTVLQPVLPRLRLNCAPSKFLPQLCLAGSSNCQNSTKINLNIVCIRFNFLFIPVNSWHLKTHMLEYNRYSRIMFPHKTY